MSAPKKDLDPQAATTESPLASGPLQAPEDVTGDAADTTQEHSGDTTAGLGALLDEAREQAAGYHDQLMRAHAELENVRRRAQEDIAKARKFGTESFAESLIPVRDSLEAALALKDQSAEDWQQGVESTLRQLNTAFERNQMREIAPAAGDAFDPHRHQAISTIPSGHAQGTIAQVLQKGYTLAERVLRPALVMVSSGEDKQG